MDLHVNKVWLPGAASCLLFLDYILRGDLGAPPSREVAEPIVQLIQLSTNVAHQR